MNINNRYKLSNEEDEMIHVDEIKGILVPPAEDIKEVESVFIEFTDLYGANKSLAIDPREIMGLIRQFGEEIKSASNTLNEVENN